MNGDKKPGEHFNLPDGTPAVKVGEDFAQLLNEFNDKHFPGLKVVVGEDGRLSVNDLELFKKYAAQLDNPPDGE